MPSQDEHNSKTDQPLTSIESEDTAENAVSLFKTLSLSIGGLILLVSIFALLPMFFTYLSEGDTRPPSEIHPTDSARKRSQNAYHLANPEKQRSLPGEKTGDY